MNEVELRVRSCCGHRDRSTNDYFRDRQALVMHRREQKTAFERRSTPATQVAPHSGHSARPAPLNSAATRFRNRWSCRHCLLRQAAEQNLARVGASDDSGLPQPSQNRLTTSPTPSDIRSA